VTDSMVKNELSSFLEINEPIHTQLQKGLSNQRLIEVVSRLQANSVTLN